MTTIDEALRALENEMRGLIDRHPEYPDVAISRWADRIAALLTTRQEVAPVADGLEFFAAPEALHPATANLVARFASALAEKLATAERKYGYSDGWASPDWMDECRAKLMEHVAKGDPRDVAAYCAFLWHHGESTSTGQTSDARAALAYADPKELSEYLGGTGGPFLRIGPQNAIRCAPFYSGEPE